MKTSVQITHAGERNPTTSSFASAISDPALASDGSLTQVGADTMFAFGKEWADIWADNDDWVDFSSVNSAEVYMAADNTTLAKDSLA